LSADLMVESGTDMESGAGGFPPRATGDKKEISW